MTGTLAIGAKVMTPIGLIGVVDEIVTDPLFTTKGIPVIVDLGSSAPANFENGKGWWYQHELKELPINPY